MMCARSRLTETSPSLVSVFWDGLLFFFFFFVLVDRS